MVALFLLLFLLVMGVLTVLGRTADSRDPEFGLGRVIDPIGTPHRLGAHR